MTPANEGLGESLGIALREIRIRRDLSIMDLAQQVSGRTYISALERGAKQPTLAKIDEISRHLGLHPLALLVYAYQIHEEIEPIELMARIKRDLESIQLWEGSRT